MLLLSLLLVPIIGIFMIASLSYENTSSLSYENMLSLLRLAVPSVMDTIDFDALYKTNSNFYLGIDGISIHFPWCKTDFFSWPVYDDIGSIGVIVLICFVLILSLIIVIIPTIDPSCFLPGPKLDPLPRERTPERDFPRSDLVWIYADVWNRKFIFDQYNSNGAILFAFLGLPGTTPATYLVNGVPHVGIVCTATLENNIWNDEIRRRYNPLVRNVNFTSRHEPLRHEGFSVILKRFY